MRNRAYQICNRCVMDTSDSQIVFDEKGECDHCKNYDEHVKPNWHTDERGKQKLEAIIHKIKEDGKGRDFDCLMGMSGGADSSYMLHMVVKEFGLRPLVFHVDGGWNTDIAVNNIQVLIDGLNLDLYTEVINWEEMKDFQLALFKSGMPGIDLAQDHAFIATLYNFADRYNIKYILNGGNFSTECVRNPKEFFYYGTDMPLIRDVLQKFGTIKLDSYPFSSVFRHKIFLRYFRKIQVIKPLNYFPYIKEKAMQELNNLYGWTAYPQKHFESRFTRFFEGYWLPARFGFDTRRVQYSSLILTGQMTREEALKKMERSALDEETVRREFEYVANKLEISVDELQSYFEMPKKSHNDYKNSESLFNMGAKVLRLLGIERSIKR